MSRRVAPALMLAVFVLCGYDQAANATPDTAAPPAPASTGKLNDTGITWGGNYPKDINQDCSASFNPEQIKEFQKFGQLIPNDPDQGDILSQQDCKHGRDVTANDNRDGDAGFVYRKVGAKGQLLDANAKSWDCVLDEITGLLWEVKKGSDGTYGNRGLHDSDDLFTWYNPNVATNGGQLGDWNSQYNQCAGYTAGQPMTYCNIEEFAGRVNQKGLCGFKDWRVPTLTELASLTHYGRSDPAIDTAYFPHLLREQFYWSGTPSADVAGTAWALIFQFGQTGSMRHTDSLAIMLVRNWKSEAEKPASK
jgi:hypothetical protein